MHRHTCRALALATTLSCTAVAAPDGHLDPTFGQGGQQIVDSNLFPLVLLDRSNGGLAVLPDGHIVMAGTVAQPPQSSGIRLAQLKPNGQVDESFGQPFFPPGLAFPVVLDMAAQPDGKLVIIATDLETGQSVVCRFRPDGSLDTDFATAQPNLLPPGCRSFQLEDTRFDPTAIALQRDGRILMVGAAVSLMNATIDAMIVRLDGHGNPDASFDDDGIHILQDATVDQAFLRDVALTPDGDVVAVGQSVTDDNTSWQIVRLRGQDGAPDTDFDDDGFKTLGIDMVGGGFDTANAVSILPDGRIVIGGQVEGLNGECPAVARLHPDGQFDESLDGGGLFMNGTFCLQELYLSDMLVQSDGRIVLAGNWNNSFFATRILPQGGFDTGFGALGATWFDFGPFYGVKETFSYAVRVASYAGRPILAGVATSEDGADFAVARLDNDLIYADDLE